MLPITKYLLRVDDEGICEALRASCLQIFEKSVCPSTLFFESLTKKPPTTMDDFFKRANKYFMLEDDVRATTQ